MLVLSRVEGQSISFPELAMAIEVLKVSRTRVQLGVHAIDRIRVLRTELIESGPLLSQELDSESQHRLRNRINAISLAMAISQRHLERGDYDHAEAALLRVASIANEQVLRNPAAGVSVSTGDSEKPQTGHQILLVEDNPNERNLLSDVLKFHGLRVRVAKNGLEAIELLQVITPRAILLDMEMPHCDGPSTIREIRRNPRFRSIPIFAVTGVAFEDGIEKISDVESIHNWFQKPVQSELLIKAISELEDSVTHCA